MPPPKAIADINAERDRQDRMWGGPDHDDERERTDWLRFIRAHARDALKAVNAGELDDYRTELVQLAALAVAAIEVEDRRNPPW